MRNLLVAAIAFGCASGAVGFAAAASPATPTLRRIADIRTFPGWDGRHAVPVALEGTVTAVDHARDLLILQEGEDAIALRSTPTAVTVQPGNRVRVEAADSYPAVLGLSGYPWQPSEIQWLTAFEISTSWTANYVDRLRAELTPPATGNYQFWLSSDDTSELWLSEDDRPEHARRVAFVAGWTDPREWFHYKSQHVESVMLEAGRRYFIEVLHEQGIGAGHVEVSWQGPTVPQSVLGGEYLAPWISPSSAKAMSLPPPHGVTRELWRHARVASTADLTPGLSPNSILQLQSASVQVLGLAAPPVAQVTAVGAPLPPGTNFRWTEVTGVVSSVSVHGKSLELELTEGDKRMAVRILDWRGSPQPHLRGYTVRLTGVCESLDDERGRPIAGLLWIPTADAVPIVSASADWIRIPSSYISDLMRGPPARQDTRVKIRGRVLAQSGPQSLTLQDEGSFSAYYSADGAHWTQIGEVVNVPMTDAVYAGLAVTSHHNEASASATFAAVTGLSDLEGTTVGTRTGAGAVARNGDQLTVIGQGEDIWDRPDQFYFAHRTLAGDTEVAVQLTSVQMPSRWAKAGIMVRESLADNAAYVDLVDVGDTSLSLQWRRTGAGSRSSAVYVERPVLPCWLKLSRRHYAITVTLAESQAFATGTLVDVVGLFQAGSTGPRITEAVARISGPDDEKSEIPPRPLLDISTVLTTENTSLPDSLSMRGVITGTRDENGRHFIALQDASGGMFIPLDAAMDIAPPVVGDFVEVQCDPSGSTSDRAIVAVRILPLGKGTLPTPLPHPMQYLTPRKGEGRWVQADGIVYATDGNGRAILRGTSGYVYARSPAMSAADWSALIDCRVRIKGVAAYPNPADLELIVPGAASVEILEPAPPAEPSPRRINDLLGVERGPGPSHRVRIAGVATFADDHLVIVEDDTGAARVRTLHAANVRVGQRVEAFGFPAADANASLEMANANVRVVGPGQLPTARKMNPAELLGGHWEDRLVVVEAILDQQITTDAGTVLELHAGNRTFRAWCPGGRQTLGTIPAGARLKLTGIASTEPRRSSAVDPVSAPVGPAVQLITRGSEDVVVVERPPWWRLRQAVYAVAVLAAVLIVVILWVQILRARIRERTRQLSRAMDQLKQETELSATLAERNRLAGEIHDSLEQGFSGVMLQLDATLRLPDCPPEVRESLTLTRSMVSFSRAEVRHAVWDLQSPVLDEADMPTALRRMAQSASSAKPRVSVETDGEAVPVPSPIDHHVLRIAQETITNAIKHAHATVVNIRLEFLPGTIHLTVRDDGCGFDPEAVLAGQGHFGLRSLRSRARRIRSQLHITSRPGHGTSVELTVPLPPPPDATKTLPNRDS